jgi:hypothetical protein
MRRMREDSGRFWMILLAGLALMGWLMPTPVALAQNFTVTLPRLGTVDTSTGEVTLTVEVTCNVATNIDGVFCSALQIFGRTHFAEAFGFTDVNTSCAAGDVTSVTVVLEPEIFFGGTMLPGPTIVNCEACTNVGSCDEVNGSVNLIRTR